ncbi:uncharacterized protein LOC131605239 [Vicia villosa]|uniref:uncharacterized protein LOC131605239 n=1 Tax=Vicia villosa TaxID=3911 RepID=UPI00273BD1CB|nr:uncharacterized protein LOC131605239 [Vicia villosa]
MDKEGGYNNIPFLLYGSNYDWWKVRMMAFLKSMENKAWKVVLKGFNHLIVKDKDWNVSFKPEDDWYDEDDKLALGNSKALNALFNGVDKNIFKLINTCTVAKDAWEILRTTHKGTSKFKMFRLQLLTTKLENLKMNDDERIQDFCKNVLEISNASSGLGEKMLEAKLVKKILRSLPTKLDMKVTAIEEAQDINNMRVDELIGLLQAFEVLINLNLVLNKVKKKPDVQDISSSIRKDSDDQKRVITTDNYFSKNDKEVTKKVINLTGRYEYDKDSYNEDPSYEELVVSYKELYEKFEEMCKLSETQKKVLTQIKEEKEKLLAINLELQDKVNLLSSEIENITSGSDMIDEYLN